MRTSKNSGTTERTIFTKLVVTLGGGEYKYPQYELMFMFYIKKIIYFAVFLLL